MPRNRKPKSKEPRASRPSEVEIPEGEQWRLIKDSGVLQQAHTGPIIQEEPEEDTPLAEEIFQTLILLIPFSFLLLMMEILIHYQYGRQPTYRAIMDRMLPSVPILSIFIFYTSRYKQHRRVQFFLFLLSCIVGTRMIYLINRASWLVNMRQCPPLGTIWVYAIVQLDLGPAVASLVFVGTWVWWKGMKLVF